MQFVDVVSQQVRPSQPLPAPDRIVHVERHIRPLTRSGSPRESRRSPISPPGQAAELRWHCSVRRTRPAQPGWNQATRAGCRLRRPVIPSAPLLWRNLPQGTPLNPFR
jgi:hypothetical protein